jgi:hypothetical protein
MLLSLILVLKIINFENSELFLNERIEIGDETYQIVNALRLN